MNAKAETLHLDDSFFANPTGLDEEGLLLIPPSHSSTLDLARLSVEALKNPVFAQIVGTPKIVVTDVAGKIVHELFNINELLFYLEGKGSKDGLDRKRRGMLGCLHGKGRKRGCYRRFRKP